MLLWIVRPFFFMRMCGILRVMFFANFGFCVVVLFVLLDFSSDECEVFCLGF